MSEKTAFNPNLILPVGTQVVMRIEIKNSSGEIICPNGSVGIITEAPSDALHSYRVRLLNGETISVKRQEIAIRKQFQQDGLLSDALSNFNLYDCVIYRCIVGSRAYGLDDEDSDTDRRGIYLPPAELHWSLYGVPEQLENSETEECYWEIRKFLILALKANPNVLECLYTPLIEKAEPLALELVEMRSIFLSKIIYQTYNGYVMSQFKKLEQDLRNRGAVKWKHAMHLIRLLLSGIAVLKEGFVAVRVEQHREMLLSIKRGEVAWEEINGRRLELHKEFDQAFASTKLPERPDYEKANEYLIKARRSKIAGGL